MNDTYLGVMERGGNMPTLATIFKLADVFGVEAADLVREIEKGRKPAAIRRRRCSGCRHVFPRPSRGRESSVTELRILVS